MSQPRIFIDTFGAQNGRALLFFHGFPGSHRQADVLRPLCEAYNLRVLAVDRPGYGFSEPMTKGGLQRFIAELDEVLTDEQFFVVGISGGNAAALSAASHFGPRVLALACVCGLAPFAEAAHTYSASFQKGLKIARHMPMALLRPTVDTMMRGFDPSSRFEDIIRKLSPRDQDVLRQEHVRQTLLDSVELARRQGSAGILFDLKSFAHAWPVDWKKIVVPTLIWHGGDDSILSEDMAHFLASRLPQAKLRIFPEEGHYSLPILRAEEILTALTEEVK